jgi:hypothetical protein
MSDTGCKQQQAHRTADEQEMAAPALPMLLLLARAGCC